MCKNQVQLYYKIDFKIKNYRNKGRIECNLKDIIKNSIEFTLTRTLMKIMITLHVEGEVPILCTDHNCLLTP